LAYLAPTKQKLRYNNFGWNLGGPILLPGGLNKNRDKLFFFTGMEFKRLSRGNLQNWNVPLPAQRNGDFSAVAAPRDPANNQPFPGGIIPAARFSPNGKRLVDLYPQPNFTGTGGNFRFFAPDRLDTNQYILKGDYNLSERHQLAVHWLRDYYTSVQNITNTVLYDRDIPGTNMSAKWTWVTSPTTVNTFQFTFTGNVILQGKFRPNPILIRDYSRQANGITYPMIYGNETSIPNITISGFNALNTQPRNWNNFNRVFQGKYDLSKVLGSHNFKVGTLIMRSRKNQDNQPAINGSFNFSPGHALHSGNSLADALLGNFNTYTEASAGREGWFRFSQAEFYVADNWKASSHLTLDLGLRYMLMQPQYAALQNAVVFAPRFFDPARIPQILSADGQVVPGTGDPVNGLVAGGTELPESARIRIPNASDPEVKRIYRGLPKEISPYDLGTLGPRVGFAYDLTGRQQTVVRGGWGLFYERIQGNFVFGRVNNPPFVQEAAISSANVERPAGGTQRIFPSNITSYDIDLKIPAVQNWSLGVQHKLWSDTLLDVAYVGSSGWHQYRGLNLNQLRAGTLQRYPGVNVQALRPYLGFGGITHYITASNFNYHSMQAQFKKQLRHGGLFNIAYTWSRSMTDSTGWDTVPQDSYNFKVDYSASDFDRRHIFVASYIYPLPFWRATDAWYKKAFGGWQLSGVTTIQTGRPINLSIAGDTAGIGQGGQRPDLIGDWSTDAGTATRWFNQVAFANPAAGTFGNLGRNALYGPGTHNWDISAQKQFRFTESINLEFRAEAYNAPHHFSYFAVATQLGATNFGQVTSATDPRTFQFG
ncbi:MAG TPA: carboxypeptidase regulatory-like domain-containing protein, partial [Terriglobales bacterium]